MKFSQMITFLSLNQQVNSEWKGNDPTILRIEDDSRKVRSGDLFIARSGSQTQGHQFIEQALSQGAVAVLSAVDFSGVKNDSVPVYVWPELNQNLNILLAYFYDHPAEKLQFFGVTGTNGKTTISYLVHSILNEAQGHAALSGTIQKVIGTHAVPSHLTTPGMVELYQFLNQALQQNSKSLVMEVSSHALDQGRIDGLKYTCAILTNLTQDHLDYHQNMENYFWAKRRLFADYLASDGIGIVNGDDDAGQRILKEFPQNTWMFSIKNKDAQVHLIQDLSDEQGLNLSIKTPFGVYDVQSPLLGEFNKENILASVAVAAFLKIDPSIVFRALKKVQVPGRIQRVLGSSKRVFVDYAHTPDAIERVLQSLRSFCKGKLHIVFGCGGDRDKTKRPKMAKAAEGNADVIWVTSDNPRSENPEQILQDIRAGLSGAQPTHFIVDRALAISHAVQSLEESDLLVIAGKGHEDYQIFADQTIHFSDYEEAQKALKILETGV